MINLKKKIGLFNSNNTLFSYFAAASPLTSLRAQSQSQSQSHSQQKTSRECDAATKPAESYSFEEWHSRIKADAAKKRRLQNMIRRLTRFIASRNSRNNKIFHFIKDLLRSSCEAETTNLAKEKQLLRSSDSEASLAKQKKINTSPNCFASTAKKRYGILLKYNNIIEYKFLKSNKELPRLISLTSAATYPSEAAAASAAAAAKQLQLQGQQLAFVRMLCSPVVALVPQRSRGAPAAAAAAAAVKQLQLQLQGQPIGVPAAAAAAKQLQLQLGLPFDSDYSLYDAAAQNRWLPQQNKKKGVAAKQQLPFYSYSYNNAASHAAAAAKQLQQQSQSQSHSQQKFANKLVAKQYNLIAKQQLELGKIMPHGRNIEETYKLLLYFFKSLNCLIGKPVILFTPDKVTIQLLYFLNIPKKKIYKFFAIYYISLIRKNWIKKMIEKKKKKIDLLNKKKINFFLLASRQKWKNKKVTSLGAAASQQSHSHSQSHSQNNIRLPKLKFKIRKSMSSFKRKPYFLIKLFFKLRRNNISKVFSKKLKIISNILSNKYNKPVEFQLIRTHYPIYDSNILINLLDLNIKNKKKKSKIAIKKIYSSLRGKNAIKVLNDDASRLKKQKRPVFASRAKQAPWMRPAAARELAVAVQQLVGLSRSPFGRFATREEASAAALEAARRELMGLPPLPSFAIGQAKVGGVHAARDAAKQLHPARTSLLMRLRSTREAVAAKQQPPFAAPAAAAKQLQLGAMQHSYYINNASQNKKKGKRVAANQQANQLNWYGVAKHPVFAAAAKQQRHKKFGAASHKFVATQLVEIPAFLSGLNIKIAGRLMKEPILPRRTTKKKVKGATATGKVNFLDIATIKNKNKKGAYTITIKSGHNFF